MRPDTRAIVSAAPDFAPPMLIEAGTITVTVRDDDWERTHAANWRHARERGRDLVIGEDGSFAEVAHLLTPEEQAQLARRAAVRAFVDHPAPTQKIKDDAMRAIIEHLGLG